MYYKNTFPTDASHAYGSRKQRNSRRAASPPVESFGREGVGFGEGKGTLFQKGSLPLPNLKNQILSNGLAATPSTASVNA